MGGHVIDLLVHDAIPPTLHQEFAVQVMCEMPQSIVQGETR